MGCASLSDPAGIQFEAQQAGLRPLSYTSELKRHPAAGHHGAWPSGGPCEKHRIFIPAKRLSRPVTS